MQPPAYFLYWLFWLFTFPPPSRSTVGPAFPFTLAALTPAFDGFFFSFAIGSPPRDFRLACPKWYGHIKNFKKMAIF